MAGLNPATQRARDCGPKKRITRSRGGRGEENELCELRVSAWDT